MLATVSATALNVRSIPNITGKIIGVLSEGSVVDIPTGSDDWCEITYRRTTGFVYKHYLAVDSRVSDLTGFVSTSLLNVRDRPAAGAQVLGTLTYGTRIRVSAKLQEWLEIEFNQTLAYVAAQYVALFQAQTAYTVMVETAVLNVRAAPSVAAPILGQLMGGRQLEIDADIGQWSAFRFNGSWAYIATRYLRKTEVASEPAPVHAALTDDRDELTEEAPRTVEPSQPLQPMDLLPVSGNAEERKVAATWNRYGGLLDTLSTQKSIDVACAVSVLCVESSGKGFEQNNQDRMIIRFENHKFWRYWGRDHPDRFKQHFQFDAHQPWKGHQWRGSAPASTWQSFHGSQLKEWQVFEFARKLDADAAMLSISMGAPQIMGFHYQRIGYATVDDMFRHFSLDISYQINGLFDFLSDSMLANLRQLDFVSFAAGYNGSGQKQQYGQWIHSHYLSFKTLTRSA